MAADGGAAIDLHGWEAEFAARLDAEHEVRPRDDFRHDAFHVVVAMRDPEVRDPTVRIEEEPRVVHGVSERLDVTEQGRDVAQSVAESGGFLECEVDLNGLHGGTALSWGAQWER